MTAAAAAFAASAAVVACWLLVVVGLRGGREMLEDSAPGSYQVGNFQTA